MLRATSVSIQCNVCFLVQCSLPLLCFESPLHGKDSRVLTTEVKHTVLMLKNTITWLSNLNQPLQRSHNRQSSCCYLSQSIGIATSVVMIRVCLSISGKISGQNTVHSYWKTEEPYAWKMHPMIIHRPAITEFSSMAYIKHVHEHQLILHGNVVGQSVV